MTVARMRDEMPNLEHVQWTAYFAWRAATAELETKKAEAPNGR